MHLVGPQRRDLLARCSFLFPRAHMLLVGLRVLCSRRSADIRFHDATAEVLCNVDMVDVATCDQHGFVSERARNLHRSKFHPPEVLPFAQ
jgi:hypothetical protein